MDSDLKIENHKAYEIVKGISHRWTEQALTVLFKLPENLAYTIETYNIAESSE